MKIPKLIAAVINESRIKQYKTRLKYFFGISFNAAKPNGINRSGNFKTSFFQNSVVFSELTIPMRQMKKSKEMRKSVLSLRYMRIVSDKSFLRRN